MFTDSSLSPSDPPPATDLPTETPARPPRPVWREYVESIVVTAIMALFGMTFVVQAVKVPTGSMQNTILIGDHLLVNKFIFAAGPHLPFLPQRDIRRGDIIVFKYPGDQNNPALNNFNDPTNAPYKTNYVKRVIGLPGETVEVRGDKVLINGQVLDEQRLTAEDPGLGLAFNHPLHQAPLTLLDTPPPSGGGNYQVYYAPESRLSEKPRPEFATFRTNKVFRIPDDAYFAMGDNRDNSADSRYWGVVQRDLIIGRAMFVYWSYDESLPSDGNFLTNFFTHTRWSRTGHMIR